MKCLQNMLIEKDKSIEAAYNDGEISQPLFLLFIKLKKTITGQYDQKAQ